MSTLAIWVFRGNYTPVIYMGTMILMDQSVEWNVAICYGPFFCDPRLALHAFFFPTEDASESQKCVLNEKNVMRSVWSILDEMGEGELFAMLLCF